jgi:UPF0716 protein FxsA
VLAVLALLFLAVPILELAVIIQVGRTIGVLDTLALLVLISLTGAWLVRREGLGVLRRIQQQMNAGEVPGTELVDGLLILLGGALMLTPGFVTDAFGLALLLPPVRAAVRTVVARRLRRRVITYRFDALGDRYEGPYT